MATLLTAFPGYAATIYVNAGDDLQAAVNSAAAGDTIVLQSGATFAQSLTLPPTPHATPVVIKSSVGCADRRMTAADATAMATLRPGHPAEPIIYGDGVKGWRFECVRLSSPGGYYFYVLLTNARVGNGSFRNTDNVTFDRIVVVAGNEDPRSALAVNGSNITVTRSHIENVRKAGAESKAVQAWDGPGPFTIRDNFLEAASINVLFGGANTSSAAHIPSNILVENNHLYKRPSWRGAGLNVKNIYEMKNGTRATVRNNLLENSWLDGQAGEAIVLQAYNDEGGSPWNKVEDVLITGNTIRGAERGMALNGNDYTPGHNSSGMTRISITNNLFDLAAGLGGGWFMLAGGEIGSMTISHNTINNPGRVGYLTLGGVALPGGAVREAYYAIATLTFTNNLLRMDGGGLGGDGSCCGVPTLNGYVPTYHWTHNTLAAGPSGQSYPGTNLYPTLATHQAEFNADYTLVAGSTYRGAGDDGQDLGRVWGTTSSVAAPLVNEPTPSPTPPPSSQFEVVSITVVDADTAIDIGPADGVIVPAGVAIALRANTNPIVVGSVRFNVNGVVNVESAAPYAMPGDSGGIYHKWYPAAGSYVVTATPFEGPSMTGLEGTSRTVTLRVAPPETCGNRIDDDLDGLVDEGCTPTPPPPSEICNDGIDNDGNGLVDEGCAPPPPPPSEVCNDGLDNDGDGLVDEGCAPPPPPPSEICTDGIDNDGDGLVDEGCPVPPSADTTAPVVTFTFIRQNQNAYKFRIDATDASGIASVTVFLNGQLAYAGIAVPASVDLSIRSLPRGTHSVQVVVADQRGNVTTLNRTIAK